MRITQSTIYQNIRQNISRVTEQLKNINEQIGSSKRINKPSDDPLGLTHALNLKGVLSQINQYGTNINHGQSWLQAADSSLQSVQDLITRAKVLANQMSTETYNATDRANAAREVQNITEQLVQIGNTQVNGRYIFSGDKDRTAAFGLDFTTHPAVAGPLNNAAYTGTASSSGTYTGLYSKRYVVEITATVGDVVYGTGWGVGTPTVLAGGVYTGSVDKSYTFTVPAGTVGTGDIPVGWSESTTGRSGTITIPNGYTPGTAINVDGVNNVVEVPVWTGTSHATSSGNYTAADNQQYTFTVPTVTLDGANLLVTVNWTKVGGGIGSFDIPANYVPETELVVENGLKVSFDAGNLVIGDTFTVDTEQGPTVSFSTGAFVNGEEFSISVHDNAVGTARYRVSEDGGVAWGTNTFITSLAGPTDVYSDNSREVPPNQGVHIDFTNSGTLTAGDRFTIEVSQYNGDSGDMNIIIGPAAQLKTNVAGNTAFGQAGDTTHNLFDILAGLKDSLQRNVTSGVQAALEWLGNAQDNNTSNMADIGARLNRIEVNRNMLSDLEAYNTNRLSGIEDLDIAKASLELNSKQMIFQAALYSAAKVTGLSLLNYL